MKNKIWNPKLYFEMFRQSRCSIIIFSLISVISSSLFPFSQLIGYYSSDAIRRENFGITDLSEPSFTGIFIFTAFMSITVSWILLSHLSNKRASDFYHSIPISRSCYFITAISMVLTACMASALISLIVTSLLCLMAPIFHLTVSVFINSLINCLAIALLITGIMFFAFSASGTKFTSTILFLVIFFAPRTIILVITHLVSNITFVTGQSIFPLSEAYYNIPFGMLVTPLFSDFTSATVLANPSSMIYTSVVGIIYIIIAFFITKYRKSELAENSAPNKYIRHIYAVILAFTFSVIFTNYYINCYYGIYDRYNSSINYTIIIVLTVLIFFAYEAISSKSLKKALYSAPIFVAVIVLNVILTSSIIGLNNFILNFAPSADDIKSITVTPSSSQYSTFGQYNMAVSMCTTVEDKELNKLFAEKYSRCLKLININRSHSISQFEDTFWDYISLSSYVTVKLKDGRTMVRRVSTSDFENLYIEKVSEAKGSKRFDVPKDYEISEMFIYCHAPIEVSIGSLTNSTAVWNTFKEEYNSLPDNIKESIGNYDNNDVPAQITIYGKTNGIPYTQTYNISSVMPKTLQKFFETLQKEENVDTEQFIKAKNENLGTYFIGLGVLYDNNNIFNTDKTITDRYTFINLIEDNNKISTEQQIEYVDKNAKVTFDNIQKALTIIMQNNTSAKGIDLNRPIFCIYITTPEDKMYTISNMIFQLSDEDMATIKKLLPPIINYSCNNYDMYISSKIYNQDFIDEESSMPTN